MTLDLRDDARAGSIRNSAGVRVRATAELAVDHERGQLVEIAFQFCRRIAGGCKESRTLIFRAIMNGSKPSLAESFF